MDAADETESLSRAMSAGDRNAVEVFYRRYFDWLYAQARRACRRDQAFCLDVVQEAVLRIVRTVRPVVQESQFRAWLKLVIHTTALDLLRGETRRLVRERVVAGFEMLDDHEVDRREQIDWLARQIEQCDPQIVRMIELRYEERWSLAKIGGLLGMSIGTVDGRIRRALNTIRQRAIEEFDE